MGVVISACSEKTFWGRLVSLISAETPKTTYHKKMAREAHPGPDQYNQLSVFGEVSKEQRVPSYALSP